MRNWVCRVRVLACCAERVRCKDVDMEDDSDRDPGLALLERPFCMNFFAHGDHGGIEIPFLKDIECLLLVAAVFWAVFFSQKKKRLFSAERASIFALQSEGMFPRTLTRILP